MSGPASAAASLQTKVAKKQNPGIAARSHNMETSCYNRPVNRHPCSKPFGTSRRQRLPNSGHRDPGAHQADAVEIGLLPGAFFGTFPRLIAFVEQFDLLEFLERLAQNGLGILKLHPQFVCGSGEILRR